MLPSARRAKSVRDPRLVQRTFGKGPFAVAREQVETGHAARVVAGIKAAVGDHRITRDIANRVDRATFALACNFAGPQGQAALPEGRLDLTVAKAEHDAVTFQCRRRSTGHVVDIGHSFGLPTDTTAVCLDRPTDAVAGRQIRQTAGNRRGAGGNRVQILRPDNRPCRSLQRSQLTQA